MLLFWKLVLLIKMSTSQDFKTIFKYNLTCIFFSLRAQLKKPLCPRTPCTKNGQVFLWIKYLLIKFTRTFSGYNLLTGNFWISEIYQVVALTKIRTKKLEKYDLLITFGILDWNSTTKIHTRPYKEDL